MGASRLVIAPRPNPVAFGATPAWLEQLGKSLVATAQDVAEGQNMRVVLDTNVSKPQILFDANNPNPTQTWLQRRVSTLVQPTIYVQSNLVNKTIAPYGPATRDLAPAMMGATGVVVALACIGLYSLLR